ncbi:hypothetical protein N9R79_09910 [Vibrio sp.]|nr:hypothetical protein [Vibrio sp.]
MKILTIAMISISGMVSNASIANDSSNTENHEGVIQTINTSCVTCDLTMNTILTAMNQECGFPITEENEKFVARSHPVYAFAYALSTAFDSNQKKVFNKALIDNADCFDSESWMESTRESMVASS